MLGGACPLCVENILNEVKSPSTYPSSHPDCYGSISRCVCQDFCSTVIAQYACTGANRQPNPYAIAYCRSISAHRYLSDHRTRADDWIFRGPIYPVSD